MNNLCVRKLRPLPENLPNTDEYRPVISVFGLCIAILSHVRYEEKSCCVMVFWLMTFTGHVIYVMYRRKCLYARGFYAYTR